VIGIPFYVWDMAERFQADVVDDFVAEYAAGRTPNPCLRCNEKIKFAAVLDRALALGFDAVATGHYARREAPTPTAPGGTRELHRAVDPAKDQSYVLGVLTRSSSASLLPARRHDQGPRCGRRRRSAGWLGGQEARQPRHLLHRRRRHRRLAAAGACRRHRRAGARGIRGVAPGQSVVLYDGTRVVGSATIATADRRQVSAGQAPS
jgi:tRNA U34 2-thiouridine synthase MnmA/TrmU